MVNVVVALNVWAIYGLINTYKFSVTADLWLMSYHLTGLYDQILAICARNIWLFSALENISVFVSHIQGS